MKSQAMHELTSEQERFFADMRRVTAEYSLAEPDNPYRQSGRAKGAARWEESRRCIAEAIQRDGDFMDIGCANGLLLESLPATLKVALWSPELRVRIPRRWFLETSVILVILMLLSYLLFNYFR